MNTDKAVMSRLHPCTSITGVRAEGGKEVEDIALEHCAESPTTGVALGRTYRDGTQCDCDMIDSRYYSSGALLLEVPIVHGEFHGTARSYFESGELLAEWVYDHDKLISTTSHYKANYDKL
jgi:hypothetical protein